MVRRMKTGILCGRWGPTGFMKGLWYPFWGVENLAEVEGTGEDFQLS